MESELKEYSNVSKSMAFRTRPSQIVTAKPLLRKPRNLTPPMFIADID